MGTIVVAGMADTRSFRVRLEEALAADPRDVAMVTYLQSERNAEIARETGNNCVVFIMWLLSGNFISSSG